MRVTMETKVELMTDEQLFDVLDELDRLQSELSVRMAYVRALRPRPAIKTPAWFQELL